MMMDDDNEIPLHSVKSLVRRLKNANGRLSRNTDVFSMDHSSTKDVEVMNNRYHNDYLQVDEIDDVTIHEQNEELSSSSTTPEDPIDYESDTNLCSMMSDDDHERNSYQPAQDPATDNAQSFLPDARQISIALALFRHRHSLSKSCINDLCELLRYLGVKGVPTDFRSIERNILQNQQNILQSKKYTVCSKCGNKGNIISKCENVKYNDCSRIRDVQEGEVRRNIAVQELIRDPRKKIVTLLLNSDGIVLKKLSRSIWVTCMIINELPRAVRFNINNIIICSISVGCSKPKKREFQSFIADWVYELRQLELGFHVSPPNSNKNFVKMYAYLIAATLDKPAQALLMNINDPVGFHSCVRCTIRGKYVQSGNGTIRVFIKSTEDDIENRSNVLYDKHIFILSKRKSKLKPNENDHACGQQGPCLLRDLSYFNVGQSCVADSLHNVYAGTFEKSMTSVAHSMVHVPQTLKYFGPVQNYSTFNFESVIGSIVQSVNGPNLIVSELTNNINILKCATVELDTIDYAAPLHLFICRLFSPKRQALPRQVTTKQNKSIRLGCRLELPNDHIVMAYLGEKQIFNFSLHGTCWKNNVQFSVYESSSNSSNCDSCVLFKEKHETNCGFIMAIIHNSRKQCYAVVHTIRIDGRDFLSIKKKNVVNPFIFWEQLTDPPHIVRIDINDITVKLAHSKQDIFHFFQFPNTVEST
ncbi:unnamed protein product [Rotaria socialis]|uniref:Transposase n=1 Tax=Rotaria socialis TaxID=392032 RepID=A0A821F0J1_9BILA|nr:unnamed protein product [Rotaria socialis]